MARRVGIVIGAVLGVVVVLSLVEAITDYFGISLDAGLLAQTVFQQPQLFAVPLVAIEEGGLPLPISGDLLITYSASQVGANVSVLLLLGLAFEIAALLGSTLLFFLSRRFGSRLLRGAAGRALHLNPQRIERVEEWFRRWGMWAVVVGRQIPGFRVAVTVVAGSFGMTYGRFIAGVAIGGAIWIALFETIGVLVGRQATQLLGAHQTSGLLIFGGFFVLGLAYLVARVSWRRFRPATTA